MFARCVNSSGTPGSAVSASRSAPLLLVGGFDEVGEHVFRPHGGDRSIERDPRFAHERRSLQDPKRLSAQRRAEARRVGALGRIERTLDRALQQENTGLGGQAVQGECASLVPQAARARRHDERRTRRDVEDLFQLVFREPHVVDKNQRLLVQEAPANLCVGGFTNAAALVERFENELQEIAERQTAGREVDDPVGKGTGSRVMGQVAKQGGLAGSRLAADFQGQAGVERRNNGRQLRLAPDQAANQRRKLEDRCRAGTGVLTLGSRRFPDHGAGRIADLQEIAADRDVPGDGAVQRRFRSLRFAIQTAGRGVGIGPVELQLVVS